MVADERHDGRGFSEVDRDVGITIAQEIVSIEIWRDLIETPRSSNRAAIFLASGSSLLKRRKASIVGLGEAMLTHLSGD